LAIINAAAVRKSCNCMHCALRSTLVVAHAFHNRNILVHHARLLRGWWNLPHSPHCRTAGLTGG